MEEKDSIHKGFKIFIIVITIIALIYINRDNLLGFLQGSKSDLSLIESIEDDYDYRFFNGEIIKYNDEGIAHLEDSHQVVLQKDFGFHEPVINFDNQYIYYADGQTGHVYILDNKLETISQFNLDMNIFNIEETGKYIMVHSKEDVETLYLIDNEGSIIYKNSPDGNILNYDIGNNTYGFVTLSIDREIKSTLHLYDFQGQLDQTMDFEDEVIFKMDYIDDNILLLTDKNLYMMDRQILWSNEYSLIKNILIEDERIFLLYSNTLETLDLSGNILETLEVEENYDMIKGMEDGLILYGERDILIIKDEEIYRLTIDEDIESLSGHGNYLIVNSESSSNIYELETNEE